MYARILKFLTNLLFKPIFAIKYTGWDFAPTKRKRTPQGGTLCVYCGSYFAVMNKRQRVCFAKPCRIKRRKKLYEARKPRKILVDSDHAISRALLQPEKQED